MLAGAGDAGEANKLVTDLFDLGVSGVTLPGQEAAAQQQQREIVRFINGMAATASGPNRDVFRQTIVAAVSAKLDFLQKHKEALLASWKETQLIDAIKTGGADTPPKAGSLCQVKPGATTGRIFLYALTVAGLQSIDRAYVGVPMIIEAQFEPPSGEAEVKLDVSFGGATQELTLKRYDSRGHIYRSDPALPQGAGAAGGGPFDPKPATKGANQ
jgi:hypothetical protein